MPTWFSVFCIILAQAVTIGFAVMSWYQLHTERKRSINREKSLIGAIFATDVKEYMDAVDDLEKSPEQKLDALDKENELAEKVAKAEKALAGIPIHA